MGNRAARNLADLTRASERASDLAATQAKVATERGQSAGSMASGTDKAEFALPEALATAVVGSFILGPPGGLLLGAAQGWLGKREKQNILDKQAARNEAVSGAEAVLTSQFDTLLEGSTNDNDTEQLETLRTQQNAAFKMLRSGDPELQAGGMELMQSVQAEANGYAQRQETQRIEADVLKEEQIRVMEKQGYDRFTQLEGDFATESQGFEDIMQATNLAFEALERGNPADLWAASILVNKALDPTSVVRQEEADAIGAIGSLWDKAGTILERAKNGQSILPEQRRELSALVGSVQNGATQLQVSREGRYKEQLADSSVPIKYWDNFNRTSNVPAYEQGKLQNAGPAFEGVEEGGGALNDYIEATRQDINEGSEAVLNAFDKGMNALNSLIENPPDVRAHLNSLGQQKIGTSRGTN